MADYRKNNGKDFNFYEKIVVTNTTFGAAPEYKWDVLITFTTTGVMMLNEGTGVVEYSFNGNTIHGELDSTSVTKALSFDNRVINTIWFRIKSGSSAPITVSVQAWGN